jgi:thioredoxin-related protein
MKNSVFGILILSSFCILFIIFWSVASTQNYKYERYDLFEDMNEDESYSIDWFTDYDEAEAASKEKSKPILLYFTEASHCRWCRKMKYEILDDNRFIHLTKKKFIFFVADFSPKKRINSPYAEQNEFLKKHFDIRGFPKIVVLDTKAKYISTLGYLPINGGEYAKKLKSIIMEYYGISSSFSFKKEDSSAKW